MKRGTIAVFAAVALAVTLALAFFVAPLASSDPDGLERVAADSGFADQARDHALADGPLSDYTVRGVDGGLSNGLAGVIGVVLCFLLGVGTVWILRRVRSRQGGPA